MCAFLVSADTTTNDNITASSTSSTVEATQSVATSSAGSLADRQQISNPVIQRYFLSDSVSNAEILWALETVTNHGSYRSAGTSVALFPKMFPDSTIASKMEISRTKIGYFVNHGLAPYFKKNLLSMVESCSDVVIGFDETFNKIAQRQQMDISVGFWNPDKQEVQRRYVGSAFLTSTRAEDLLSGIKTCFEANPKILQRMSQLSMDGPNVNWRLFNDLTSELQSMRESSSFGLLNIGSCGLHVVHNSFKSGMRKTDWGMDQFLTSLYYLFKNVPLRRADYTAVTGSALFPLKFCSVRWVENQSVAGRAFDMLPHLKAYVKAVKHQQDTKRKESHPEFKRSFKAVCDSHPFSVVAKMVSDPLCGPKLSFFMASAASVEPFLREFQGEAPLVPFLYEEMTRLVTNAMQRIVKPDRLKVKPKALLEIELSNENLLTSSEVDIGFAVKAAIKVAGAKDKINEQKLLQFRNDCKNYYIAFIEKLLDRSPLRYALTRYVSCLDPSVVSTSLEVAKKRLQFCLEHLVEKDHLTGIVADKVKDEFLQLCGMAFFKVSASSYRRQDTRIDHFWIKSIIDSGKELPNLALFIRKILVLSHGNADQERGFSVNKECLVVNQSELSLVAQRITYDAVHSVGGVVNIEVTKEMMQYCRAARSRYQEYLDAKKADDATKEKEKCRKREAEKSIKELESKKAKILADAEKEAAELDLKLSELRK